MRRGGFTMIELIFVIVILGILAAVALPKFIGVSEQAKEGNLKAFVGTLNRTIAPTLWSKSMASGDNGEINGTSQSLDYYTEIPDGNKTAPDFTKCKNPVNTSEEFMKYEIGNTTYRIVCRDGNETNAPKFGLYVVDDSNVKPVLPIND